MMLSAQQHNSGALAALNKSSILLAATNHHADDHDHDHHRDAGQEMVKKHPASGVIRGRRGQARAAKQRLQATANNTNQGERKLIIKEKNGDNNQKQSNNINSLDNRENQQMAAAAAAAAGDDDSLDQLASGLLHQLKQEYRKQQQQEPLSLNGKQEVGAGRHLNASGPSQTTGGDAGSGGQSVGQLTGGASGAKRNLTPPNGNANHDAGDGDSGDKSNPNDNNSNPNEQLGVRAGKHEPEAPSFRAQLVWRNIFLFIVLHSMIPIGLYQLVSQWPMRTVAWSVFWAYASGLGVTAGTHRLWSHKSYKAHWSVEVFLMFLQTLAGQNSIYIWSRDHRVHHKFSETDADPHNIKRGFFFAHMGWLCCRKHPEVREKGKLIDLSDLEANGVVMFQLRHFWWLSLLINLAFPVLVPYFVWNERLGTAFAWSFGIRYLLTLHFTWLVNSAAHYYGSRPYDSRIEARESPFVILNGLGEGFHNYHHTFPFDYSTSEFGRYFNLTTAFIDLCSALGLVSGRRKVDRALVLRRQLRTGDGTQLADKQLEEGSNEHLLASADQPLKQTRPSAPNGATKRRNQPPSANGRPASGQQQQQQLDMIHELPYISGLTSMNYTM